MCTDVVLFQAYCHSQLIHITINITFESNKPFLLSDSSTTFKMQYCDNFPHIILVIVISRARGMYGIYCTEARGREAPRGLRSINAMHPECA